MNMREKLQQGKVLAVVGLGYVGLPLALAFAKKVQTIGFDINEKIRQPWNRRPSSLSPYRRRLRKMICPI